MLDFPASYAHKTFAFNSHRNADGTPNESNVNTTVTIDARSIVTGFRDLRDPLHLAQGGSLGRVHKAMTLVRLAGRIEAPDITQQKSISDREREMLVAFDPYICYTDSPSTDGAYAFDFTEPTADSTNYPAGHIHLRYYCRPTERPAMEERVGENGWRGYTLALVAPDPRCYEQTLGSLSLTPGAPTGNVINTGNVPGPLRLTLTMAGNGSGSFTINGFVLNLAASGSSTVIANMETCGPFGRGRRITKAGADAFSMKTSSATTWLTAPVGTTSFTISNTTNVTSCLVEWGSARA
jgi:hypothetical protein